MTRLQQIPDISDVATNYGENGLSAYINIDRSTAGRFGITPGDGRQRDALRRVRQRIVSTIFTQSEPVPGDPSKPTPRRSQDAELARPDYLPCRCRAPARCRYRARPDGRAARPRPLAVHHIGQLPVGNRSRSQPGARGSLGPAVDQIKKAETRCRPAESGMITKLQGPRSPSRRRSAQRDHADRRGDRHGPTSCWASFLRELSSTDHDPLDPAVGRGSARCGADRDGSDSPWSAIIGVILLIGIVRRTAFMMVDSRLVRARRGQVAARGDPSGLRYCASADHDDDDGGAAARCR